MTKKVLQLDKESCKYILESMLSEQKDEELKHAKQMADRDHLRDRIKEMHNNSLMVGDII